MLVGLSHLIWGQKSQLYEAAVHDFFLWRGDTGEIHMLMANGQQREAKAQIWFCMAHVEGKRKVAW